MPDSASIISASGVISGVVVAVASFGWWLRRERVEAAKARNAIAGADVTTDTYTAQALEIASLRERLNQIEKIYLAQAAQMGELLKKISEFEAKIVGIGAHHDNLILCDACLKRNQRVLAALNKTLNIVKD